MAPDGVTVHAARFAGPRPKGGDYPTQSAEMLADSPEIRTGVQYLSRMQIDVISLCFSTASYLAEPGFDDRLMKSMGEGHDVPITTAASATVAAMAALGIRRPFVVVPPWFSDEVTDAIAGYFRKIDLPAAAVRRLDLGARWADLTPYEIYDAGGQWLVEPAGLLRHVRSSIPDEADGTVVVGNGLRAVETIEWVEQDTRRPMVTANQACLWQSLNVAGVNAPITGFGRLFTLPVDAHAESHPTRTGRENLG
jgi:maleate cis-trans isomerase